MVISHKLSVCRRHVSTTLRRCFSSQATIKLSDQYSQRTCLRNHIAHIHVVGIPKPFHVDMKKYSTDKAKYDQVNNVPDSVVETKQMVVKDLIRQTNTVLSKYNDLQSPSLVTDSLARELVSTLEDWFDVSNSIVNPKRNKPNRLVPCNHDDDATLSALRERQLKDLKILCAQTMKKILTYHIKFNISSKNISFLDKNVTRPFYLVIKAWNNVETFESGSKAAMVLESWGEAYGGDIENSPTIEAFNLVLEAYAKSASGNYDRDSIDFPAEKAWDIYSLLSQLNDVTLLPNVYSCVHTIHALSHHAFVMAYVSKDLKSAMNPEVAAIRAFSIWKNMVSKLKQSNVDADVFWSAHNDILSLSSHGLLRRDEVQKKNEKNILLTVGRDTEELLSEIFHKSDGETSIIPEHHVKQGILSTMHAWIKEQKEWIKISRNGDLNEDAITYVTRAALSVEALLEKLKDSNIVPSPYHYDSVIQAYHNCLDRTIVQLDKYKTIEETLLPHISCHEILNEMETNCLPDIDARIESFDKVPASMYEDVISAFAWKANSDLITWSDLEKVDVLYRKMINMYDRNLLWIEREKQPLTVALNHVLTTYSKIDDRRHREIFQRSLSLVRLLDRTMNREQKPNVITFSILLSILLRGNMSDMGSIALKIFEEMKTNDVEPNTTILTQMIKILGTSKEADLDFCEELIGLAFKEYDNLSPEDKKKSDFNASAIFASFISAKIKRGVNEPKEALDLLTKLKNIYQHSQDPNYRPDIVLYGSVLDALSRTNAKIFLTTSLELLNEIESSFERGESEVMPTKQCYTSVIKTISKSSLKDGVDRAEELLSRMESLYDRHRDEAIRPDHMTYSVVLLTYARSRSSVDVQRAERILEIMETKAKESEIPWPNASAYISLINVYKNSKIANMGEKSDAVIKRMDETSRIFGNDAPKSNSFVFYAALNAWASSTSSEKPRKTWDLLQSMCSRYNNGDISCKPTVIVFNKVLNACAYNKNKETHKDSVKIALLTQKQFLENSTVFGACDSVFFVSLLKVFGYCIPDFKERQKFTSVAFTQCAKEGYVNKAVLDCLKKFSPKLFYELPGMYDNDAQMSLQNLPPDWYRNADDGIRQKF